MQVALRLRKCCLCFIKQKGQGLLSALGREALSSPGSLGSSSGSGMWGMQCQVKDSGVTPPGLTQKVQRRDKPPSAKRTTCLLLGLGGRETCVGDKDLGFLG